MLALNVKSPEKAKISLESLTVGSLKSLKSIESINPILPEGVKYAPSHYRPSLLLPVMSNINIRLLFSQITAF